MKETRTSMGMPITVEVVSNTHPHEAIEQVFSYFTDVDNRFSTYKFNSEIMRINRGEVMESEWSSQMHEIFSLAQKTKEESRDYFDIRRPDGLLDPSGIVKGWSIQHAALLLHSLGYKDFYIEAGGDIQSSGHTAEGTAWSIGIRHPFQPQEIIKVIYPQGNGVATSGTYERGQHIYNPHAPHLPIAEITSLTVVAPDVCEADRFATAAFAMGQEGIFFIEKLKGFEGYSIDSKGIATMTEGFEAYTRV